jgi:hypothetical protein
VQGYNAQVVTTCEQIIVAAELTQDANDFQQLEPMLTATAATLAAAGIQDRPKQQLRSPARNSRRRPGSTRGVTAKTSGDLLRWLVSFVGVSARDVVVYG